MARIPEDTIERIREATDIVEVVGRYVQLRQRGRNYFGLCPFHQEDTPSFSVSSDKQIFHCFGCGKGGNVFSFLMEYERIDFPEAARKLAGEAGIPVPESGGKSAPDSGSVGPLYEANAFAMRFFEKALYADQGKEALDYLQGRNFSEQTLRAFHVGYAPEAWDSLVIWGPKNNHSPDALSRAGLISPRRDGSGYYDRFRHRVMFPILNRAGRVVAFGGRALDPEDKAKYMNSPESPVYQKRKILYGLYQAGDAIRKQNQAVIIEGYTDLMRLWEHDIRNVVAVSGTAFTEEHAGMLSRYVDKTILCYDSDTAGIQATLRAGNLLLGAGVEVLCMELPDGHDPDSFVAEESAGAFRRLAEQAVSLLRFRLDRTAGELKDASARAVFIREALRDIAGLSDRLIRDLQIQELSELLRVDEQRLRGELQELERTGRRRTPDIRSPEQPKRRSTQLSGDERAQYELLKILLSEDEHLITYILEHLDTDQFTRPLLRTIAGIFLNVLAHQSVLDQEQALTLLNEETVSDPDTLERSRNLVARMLFELEEAGEIVSGEKMARDCLRRLELSRVRQEVERINEALYQEEGGSPRILELLRERKSLEQLKQDIRKKYK